MPTPHKPIFCKWQKDLFTFRVVAWKVVVLAWLEPQGSARGFGARGQVTVHRPLCSSSVEVERGTVVEVLRMLLATPGSSAMFKSLVKKALDGGAAMDFGAV